MYVIYHPELITAINNADAVRQFAIDLSYSKDGVINLIYAWLNISFVVYVCLYKLNCVTEPICCYFFGGNVIARKRGVNAGAVLRK